MSDPAAAGPRGSGRALREQPRYNPLSFLLPRQDGFRARRVLNIVERCLTISLRDISEQQVMRKRPYVSKEMCIPVVRSPIRAEWTSLAGDSCESSRFPIS
jgi:hypothetical protein